MDLTRVLARDLRASSLPEDLVSRAAELSAPVAVLDRDGVSGAPRFFKLQ